MSAARLVAKACKWPLFLYRRAAAMAQQRAEGQGVDTRSAAAAAARSLPARSLTRAPRPAPLPCSVLLLYWSVAFVALSYHIDWLRLWGRRNDVLGWCAHRRRGS